MNSFSFDFLQNVQWGEFPEYQIVLYAVWLSVFFIQLYYYCAPFRQITVNFNKKEHKNILQKPVSIVICATNERDNLERSLPLLLQQKYPQFEVIVINDCSSDSTEELLYALKLRHKHLQFSTIEPDNKFKHDRKLGITLGIKAAMYDSLLFTEADCRPENDHWLANMQSMFDDKVEFVIGYCRYEPKPTLFNKLLRTDAIYTSLFALSAALKGNPFKVTFKNLALSQSMFFKNKGFANINTLKNSEETLFLCRNANPDNTVVNLLSGSIMNCSQKISFRQWWIQRTTQSSLLTMGNQGQMPHHFEMFSRVFFYAIATALVVIAVLNSEWLLIAAVVPVFFIRAIAQMVIYGRIQRRWQEKNIFWSLFFYDCFSPFLSFVVALAQPNLQKIKKVK